MLLYVTSLTAVFTTLAVSMYSVEDLLESCLVYVLLTMVALNDTIRCLDKVIGIRTVLVTGILGTTDVGSIALVEIFVVVTKELEITDVWFVLLIFTELEFISYEESLEAEAVAFIRMLDRIVSPGIWILVTVIL